MLGRKPKGDQTLPKNIIDYQRKKNRKQEMSSKIEKYNEIKEKVGKYVDLQINKSKPDIPPEVILHIIIPITNSILTLLLFIV